MRKKYLFQELWGCIEGFLIDPEDDHWVWVLDYFRVFPINLVYMYLDKKFLQKYILTSTT